MRHRVLIAAVLLVHCTRAQVAKYSNEFLNVGVSGRALAMANANVASVNDVTSGYWNPAGLLGQQGNLQLGLMHAEYFAGIAKYDYIAASKRIDSNSVAGISFIRFGVDNIPNTLDLVDANGNVDYSRIKSFNAVDAAVLLSYARNIKKIKGLQLGGNFKIVRRKLGDFGGAWGFGMDMGAMYKYKSWKFGAMARDITGTFNAWTYNLSDDTKSTFEATGNDIPTNSVEVTVPKLILGAARTFMVWKDRISILAEVNVVNTFDGKRNTVVKTNLWSLEPMLGTEIGYKGFIFLRAGIGNVQKALDAKGTGYTTTYQPNMGIGIKYKIFALDYALTDIGDRSIALYSNIFSLRIDINKKPR
ncbi:MAG: putative type IX sorting system protein PorV2 [Bacteroidia bacterium]